MPAGYESMVAALKAVSQGEKPNVRVLPMAENAWNTRPDADSYGITALEFEADALYGDNLKQCVAYEGSLDLYSRKKNGDGWVPLLCAVLTEYCDGAWSLNSHQYERETGLFHWEWTFQIEG